MKIHQIRNATIIVTYNNKRYEIQYVNNIDEENVLYELQAKEVMQ